MALHCTLFKVGRSAPIDVTELLAAFGDYDFGEAPLDALHLSRMASIRGGFYQSEAAVRLAEDEQE